MELLKCLRKSSPDGSDHWVELGAHAMPAELHALEVFRLKLDATLVELGRLDCRLQAAVGSLRADLTDTHDQLHTSVSQLAQADIDRSMTQLVDAIHRARELTDEVLADSKPPQ